MVNGKIMKYKIFYLVSVVLILIISIYPVYRGITTLISHYQNGYIEAENYPKYIIPYAPICFSVILIVVLMPLFYKLFKKHTLLVTSILGVLLFLVLETGFEQIKVVEGYGYSQVEMPLESWQLSLCVQTPQVYETIKEPIYAENNPVYKIHFYIIAIIIILTVIQVIYGYTKMLKEKNYNKKVPLLAQLISVSIFIGLCVFACFTAFYRTGDIHVSPISAILMGTFFIVFGVTFGIYFGCIFYKKNKILSLFLPAIISILTTVIMYVGELVLTDGELFKLGHGILFKSLLNTPFAFIDLIIILLSGIITYFIIKALNSKLLT